MILKNDDLNSNRMCGRNRYRGNPAWDLNTRRYLRTIRLMPRKWRPTAKSDNQADSITARRGLRLTDTNKSSYQDSKRLSKDLIPVSAAH